VSDDVHAEQAQVYLQFSASLLRYAHKKVGDLNVAQDLVQEVFVDYFGMERPVTVECVRAYLFGMLKNKIHTHYMRANRVMLAVPAAQHKSSAERRQIQRLDIQRALSHCSSHTRIVAADVVTGVHQQDTAAKIGGSVRTVQRKRLTLRKLLRQRS
jgi:DNA-directed RNA polymerase specialized sigma24 family protein